MGEWINAGHTEALAKVERPMRRKVLEDFLYSIRNLYFQRENIRGRVAILGCGPQIPEVTLVCSEETRYRVPKSDVSSLTLVDRLNHREGVDNYFFIPKKNKVNLPLGKLSAELQVGFVHSDFADFLQHVPANSLDAILMFRLRDTFANILVATVSDTTNRQKLDRCLRRGGRIVASTSTLTRDRSEIQDLLYDHWSLAHFELLPNPAPSGPKLYEFTNHHAGFVIVKK